MSRWIGVVLPWQVAAIMAVALLALAIPAAIEMYYEVRFGDFPGSRGAAMLAFVPLGYAMYRMRAFHPALRRRYLEMLASTPWRPGKPLPLGPVQLVAQDIVVLTVLFGVVWLLGDWLLVFISALFFAISYLVMMGWVMFATRQPLLFYFVVWALGLMFYLVLTPWWIPVAVAAYLVAAPWLMHGFPWEFGVASEYPPASRGRETRVGWPFESLSPKVPDLPVGFLWSRHRGTLALVVGWWLFVLEHLALLAPTPEKDRPTALLFGGLLIVAAAIVRLIAYHVWFWTPTAWHARIGTARLIIPRYDQVFVAPVLAVAIWSAIAYGLPIIGVPQRFAAPVASSAAAYALLICPPSLRSWRLTGHHRILSIAMDSQAVR